MMRPSYLLLLMVTIPAWCQLTVLGPQSVYDGQTVSAIDLIANPHRNVEPLRSVLVQRAGQPYSQSNVETSITRLERTGQFPKVEVNVIPDTDGLRLNFLLEPAYHLGIVNFTGVRSSSYTRLLQETQLSDEDPYDQFRIEFAKSALVRFFQHDGYFLATVQPSTSIDDAHELVNVTFAVALGRRARVQTVRFEGPDAAEDAKLRHSIQSLRARFTGGLLKPGKPYSRGRVQKATGLIRRALSQQARLANHVQENPPQYHAETNGVDMSFRVEVGPKVIVRMTGARLSSLPFLSERERKKLIPIYSEHSIDPDLAQEGQQNLVDYFQRKGYFDVQVKTEFQRQADEILVTYEIDKGEKRKVKSIRFSGNHALAARDILPAVTVKRSHLWLHGNLSQKMLKQSERNLQALYRDHGYEDAKITSHVLRHEKNLSVVFDIEEGAQTMVRSRGATYCSGRFSVALRSSFFAAAYCR